MRRRLLVAPLLMVSLAACGSSGTKQATTATGVTSTLEGTITVAAAQSLSAAFTEIGADFEAKHPGLTVRFDFAGSAALVGQIEQGAPTDVFASADEANMQRVVAGGDADGTPTVFAHNGLAIAVAPGNPKHITTLRDLARPGVVVSLCAATVPCGSYARQAISKAGVAITPKSEETSVAGVLGRVQNGEADAGIVYTTDVKAAAGKVDGVMIPAAHNVVAAYPAVALRASGHRGAARAFVAYLRSKAGQATLAKYGFVAG